MSHIVRLCGVRMENIKNVAYGIVKMPKSECSEQNGHSSDILGIYGQNGSGKTALIEAVAIIRKLLSGGGLRNFPLADFIMYGTENGMIGARFSIESENNGVYQFLYVDYEVRFIRADEGNVQIRSEVLRAEKTESGKLVRRTLVDYDAKRDADCYLPKYRYEAVARTKEVANAIGVAQRVARLEMTSFLFSPEGLSAFCKEDIYADFPLRAILYELSEYAKNRLHIVLNARSALSGLEDSQSRLPGLNGPEVVSSDEHRRLVDTLPDMNSVLKEIIPGLTIDVRSCGKELCRGGGEGVQVELFSTRGKNVIPMRCESEGITRLVSLLGVLMCAYADPSATVLIDGLDTDIHEYLLGELLTVMADYGKGQLIFTAHNLRPLEMLDKNSLVFTTINPENRYIPMQYVKQHNNLRDMYLRTILLGGQKEELYEETDTNRIARAFRRAGKGK